MHRTLHQDGDVWWLETQEINTLARQEQDERYAAGVWDDVILDWVDEPKQRHETDGGSQLPIEPFDSTSDRVMISDVLVHGIGKPLDRCTQADKNQVARCLTHHGWKRKQEARGELRGKWFYVRSDRAE